MPNNPFFNFIRSIIQFFQRLFFGTFDFLAWLCYLSPLPDILDWLVLIVLFIGLVFIIFRSVPWDK